MKGNIPHNLDVENANIDPVKNGVNPTDNPGIMPNAKEPTGEKAVNTQSPESNTMKYPKATGSGY